MYKLGFLVAVGLLLSGCATSTAEGNELNDPYEATNRQIFDFNLEVDRMFLRPTAERYSAYVPEGVRDSLRNALDNLKAPVVFANDVLQAEPERAAETAGRFVLNSTLGIGGLFDMGAQLGIQAHSEDFGQTLGVWGVGEGPYLMLPLLGPSNPRDAAGMAVDIALDPTTYIRIKRHLIWMTTRQYLTIVDTRARNLEAFDTIERTSLDFYASTRSLYRQNRENAVRNGMPPD